MTSGSQAGPRPGAAAVPLLGEDIEAQSVISATDSAIGDSDTLSDTTSLASSVVDYVYENGRRYHRYREGEYLYPNDETEQDRLDMLHHIFLLMLDGGLYKAPLSRSPRRILDYGTGTGIYALDIADEFPGAEVIGIDLSPIQPTWIAPNLQFVVDDVEATWTYEEGQKFDYIHQRNMVGSIGDWDRLFEQAISHTTPAGYIELQEFNVWFQTQRGELQDDSHIQRWQRALVDGTKSFGKPLRVVAELADKVRSAGYVDVKEDILKVPIGTWPSDPKLRKIGQYMHSHVLDSIEPLTLALFTRVLGWTELECQVLIAKVKEEFKNPDQQFFIYTHFIYGKKPEA
ncbi:S-adenosyl-L-methionine-dependent methyltransferase [Talaromyces proteolyticus]|uniref:S-adenosyl-L-methionine-dependent methyltransferase n=1 Tax=Talaromyces proteolyticus TaxID=1131652 RepID=A0AAD4PRX8_9EURO|nr:S-adenosyl-L-methionine-dependent methyltransferase [Talaromyces proteolyticus]KAH8690025.1 S-adenosyl-L-methionine-dependent methyltransferase [Talaromyces proteolyticus]